MVKETAGNRQPKRARGRPAGGGNSAPEAQNQFLDAAERLFIRQGFSATTMEAIAREAGYSRAVMYRHFRNRDELMDALVVRVTMTQIIKMSARLMVLQDLPEVMTESLVIVATEVGTNPLLAVLTERGDGISVATLISNAPNLLNLLTSMYDGLFSAHADDMRPGLRPHDAARYILSVALSLLMGAVPGTDDPKHIRRYVHTFVLPTLLAHPPEPEDVFI